jgi:hypothetical protein
VPQRSGLAAVPPSNRRGTAAINAGGLGVDRISVSVPIRDKAGDMAWDTVSVVPRNGLSTRGVSIEVEGSKWFVGAREIEKPNGDREWWAKVEGNPSRMVDPGGHSLCPPEALHDVVGRVFEVVTAEFVGADCEVGDSRVKRIDVARDFEEVMDRSALLAGLAGVARPWSRKNNLYNDGTRNGAQTLQVGSKAGGVRLYDKNVETRGAVAEGVLRWEVEARSAWAQQYGNVRHLCEVDSKTITGLATNRWRWSGMAAEVCTRNEVVARVRASGLTPAQQRGFLGWLMETASGYESSVATNTSSRYRKWARELGVALGPETFAGSLVGHLDWDAGTVVLRAA